MKKLKYLFYLVLVVLVVVIYVNYPKLNILSGYSAKSMASSVFVAKRGVALTDSTDNNFSPVNLAKDFVDFTEKTASASSLGILTRKAIYREGLGAVLVPKGYKTTKSYLTPNRNKSSNESPFPFGNGDPKDSLFSNIDYVNLKKVVDNHFNSNFKTRAVLVVYKDHIITEKYANGFDKTSKFLGWSMTKSIMSTVFGVLQHKGLLSVKEQAPISDWENDDRRQITIHNLLQMNSGLEWDENYETISDVNKMLFLDEDMSKAQMDKKLVGSPNALWNYSSGTSNLLSKILRYKLGSEQEYLDFWYRELIDKIGMNSMILEADLAGNYVASSYSWASARDWAKFGMLYEREGNWNGEQIFSKNWDDYVVTPTPTSDGQYGAQFWLNSKSMMPDVPSSMYFANGHDGQRVFILPEQDLVVVRLGLNGDFSNNNFLKGILESIKD